MVSLIPQWEREARLIPEHHLITNIYNTICTVCKRLHGRNVRIPEIVVPQMMTKYCNQFWWKSSSNLGVDHGIRWTDPDITQCIGLSIYHEAGQPVHIKNIRGELLCIGLPLMG